MMAEAIPVFFLEPTDRENRWLRRYGDGPCVSGRSYCNGMFFLCEGDIRYTADGYIDATEEFLKPPPKSDPRWPRQCDHCGKEFGSKGSYQVFRKTIYVRLDTGVHGILDDFGPGAVWDAWWVHHRNARRAKEAGAPVSPPGVGTMIGPDGRCLVVKLPGGHEWMIDSRASNCTLPTENTHHCWVRTGRPEDGTLHVSKEGHSCAAGAGSILTPNWHGFLHHGKLVSC